MVPARPSPMAQAYLVGLLSDQIRVPDDQEEQASSLTEAFVRARQQQGSARVSLMRAVGDRALFVSGFFGESLKPKLVDGRYYQAIGSNAYRELSRWLNGINVRLEEEGWAALFCELSERFPQYSDVLAEVGDSSRAQSAVNALRVYERYLRTGSDKDRARLLRLGYPIPKRRGSSQWQ